MTQIAHRQILYNSCLSKPQSFNFIGSQWKNQDKVDLQDVLAKDLKLINE